MGGSVANLLSIHEGQDGKGMKKEERITLSADKKGNNSNIYVHACLSVALLPCVLATIDTCRRDLMTWMAEERKKERKRGKKEGRKEDRSVMPYAWI